MYQIDFKKPMHIHFIGIGGISMSGLASILLNQHFKVSGSDAHESELTKQLEAEGAILYYGQRASNLDDTPDLVVYTAAIHPDNPEYAAAVAKQIPMLSRAELLGQMMHNFKTPVAISGTQKRDLGELSQCCGKGRSRGSGSAADCRRSVSQTATDARAQRSQLSVFHAEKNKSRVYHRKP